MVPPADFSALYCPPRTRLPPSKDKTVLRGWKVEDNAGNGYHVSFNPDTGEYVVPADGLYSLVVELIPIGNAHLEHEQSRRVNVEYALRIQEPSPPGADPDDTVESEYRDVGSVNLRDLSHLKEGTVITCLRMPAATGHNCVRLKVDCVQRKKKRPRPPELSKKELKKLKKMKRKAESIASSHSSGGESASYHNSDTSRAQDTSEGSSDSEWSDGFESDATDDELPHSRRGVGRLAKRFKATPGPAFTS